MRRAATSVRLRRGGGVGEQLRSLAGAHSGGERDGEQGRVDLRGRRRWMGLFFSFFKEIVQQNFFYGTYFLFPGCKNFLQNFCSPIFLFLMKKFTKIFLLDFFLILDAKVVSSKKFLKIFSFNFFLITIFQVLSRFFL